MFVFFQVVTVDLKTLAESELYLYPHSCGLKANGYVSRGTSSDIFFWPLVKWGLQQKERINLHPFQNRLFLEWTLCTGKEDGKSIMLSPFEKIWHQIYQVWPFPLIPQRIHLYKHTPEIKMDTKPGRTWHPWKQSIF